VIPGSSKSTRLETRLPGSDINPYLSAAACIGAGLLGIERGLSLDAAPIAGSGYDAPVERYARTLAEATDRFAASDVAVDLFGAAFVEHFATSRRWEWRRFGDAVTEWELQRYFEII
jgi:glutamine synthetase